MTQLAHEPLAFTNSDASHDRVKLVPTADDQRDGAGAPAAQNAAAHRYLLVLRFAVFNLAILGLDIYLAHSVNSFAHWAEWIPLGFSAIASALTIGVRTASYWNGIVPKPSIGMTFCLLPA